MKQELKEKLIPLWMTALVVFLDQASKIIITLTIKPNQIVEVLGDFFRLVYRQNPYIIFSLGRDFHPLFQTIGFLVLPILILSLFVFFYFRDKDIRPVYRLPLAAILGGGLGNLLDRILRPGGVVDFLDFKFFGILGLERWPTFNLADTAVVCGVITVAILALINLFKKKRPQASAPEASS